MRRSSIVMRWDKLAILIWFSMFGISWNKQWAGFLGFLIYKFYKLLQAPTEQSAQFDFEFRFQHFGFLGFFIYNFYKLLQAPTEQWAGGGEEGLRRWSKGETVADGQVYIPGCLDT